MWPFKSTGPVEKLSDRQTKLERDFQTMELNWLDMRARCKRLLDRTEKAADRMEQAPGGDAPVGATPVFPGTALSPRARMIQQQILEARARKANGGGEQP